MADKVSVEDLRTFYKGTVTMYNGDPVYVVNIGGDYGVHIKYLTKVAEDVVKYDGKSFSGCLDRLGMVNYQGHAFYLQRRPVRRYQIGIGSNNVIVQGVGQIPYGRGMDKGDLSRCNTTEVANTLIGNFPTFRKCLDHVKTFGGSMAFDRQFAIDENRLLYYKTTAVGTLPRMCTAPDKVQFSRGFEYLKNIIGEITHEKIARTVGE